jgi:molybdate transport system substrate-binding protein
MNRIFLSLQIALLMMPAGSGVSAALAGERLDLFVASSLTDAAAEIARSYEKEFNATVRIVPAASSTLARQVAAGAPADVFLSADPQWVDWLTDQEIGNAGQARIFAGNGLVVIAAKDRAVATGTLTEVLKGTEGGRIAIADPEHVPAGRYAKQVLETAGEWAGIARQIVPAANVRDALRYVESGQTPFGIVYATDAKAGDMPIVATLPEPQPPIRYVALPLGKDAQAQHFVAFLSGGPADPILCRYGFRLPEGRSC